MINKEQFLKCAKENIPIKIDNKFYVIKEEKIPIIHFEVEELFKTKDLCFHLGCGFKHYNRARITKDKTVVTCKKCLEYLKGEK